MRPRGFIGVLSLFFQTIQVGVGDVVRGQQSDFVLLSGETARRRTYSDWQNAAVTSRALAKDGFYFTGRPIADVVQCIFCLGVLDGRDADDGGGIPGDQYQAYRHRRHLSHCPFVRGFDVDNIPDSDHDELQAVEDFRLEDRHSENELHVSFKN